MDARQVFASYDAALEGEGWSFAFCPRCGGGLGKSHRGGTIRPSCARCGFVQYRNPLPGVVVLVLERGRVLLGRRAPDSFRSGLWCLPGGFMEWSEDYLSAGRREVMEETGLDVGIRSVISVVSNFLSPSLHTLVIVLLATPRGGEARAGDDLDEVAWHPLQGPLPEMAFEADRHIVERYAADRLEGAPVDPLYAG